MNNSAYTNSNTHPDDEIFKVKTFINELQQVQEKYYEELRQNLRINEKGEEFLFDYVYNADEEENKKMFSELLEEITGKPYEEFIQPENSEGRCSPPQPRSLPINTVETELRKEIERLEEELQKTQDQLKANHAAALVLEKLVYQAREQTDHVRYELAQVQKDLAKT